MQIYDLQIKKCPSEVLSYIIATNITKIIPRFVIIQCANNLNRMETLSLLISGNAWFLGEQDVKST